MNAKEVTPKYTSKNVFREIAKIMPPIAVQCLLVAIVSATDALILGFFSQQALTAVTLASQLMQIFSLMMLSLGVGATALSSQYWGKGDTGAIERVLHITLQISISVGLVFMLLCILCPKIVMYIYSSDVDIIEMGAVYLRYVSVSYFFMGFSQIYIIIMKSTNRVLSSSVLGVITVILNINLDIVLVFGLFGFPKMGVAGAALATSISHGIEFVLVYVTSKTANKVRFSCRMLVKSYRTLRQKYWRYTLPSSIQMTSWMIATSITIAILGHISSDAVAASAICCIVCTIASSIIKAYANSVGIIIGQLLGKGEIEETKKCADKLLKAATLLGIILGGLICSLSKVISQNVLNVNEKVRYYLFWMLIILGAKMIGFAINSVFATGIFCAGGDIKYLLKIDFVNMWLIILPIGFVAAFCLHLSPIMVYLLVNLDEYTKLYSMIRHYKKYLWAKDLTKKEWAEPGKYDLDLRETIVERMPMGVIVLGASGKITMSNPAAEKILGISPEGLQGEPLAIFTIHDERNLAFNQCILDAIYNKSMVCEESVEFYLNDVCHKLRISTSFLEEEDANIGVLILFYDIGATTNSTKENNYV